MVLKAGTMSNLVDKKCATTEWFTPPEILEPVRELFGGRIWFDPCTTEDNPTRADGFITEKEEVNGLTYAWINKTFVNPPYGKQLYDWIEKTVSEALRGYQIVLLVSASSRWDQERWQKIYSPKLTAFCMPKGRVKFLNAEGVRCKSPPYPSLLFFYNIPAQDVARVFRKVGTVVRQEAM